MRRQQSTAGIQMFTFLDAMVCTMGALLVLVHAFARHGTEQAIKSPELKAAQENQAAIAAEIETLEWRIAELKEVNGKTEAQLGEERLKLSHVEEHQRRLLAKMNDLKIAADEMERVDSTSARQTENAEAALENAKARVRDAQNALESARRLAKANAVNYSVVPYEGPNSTHRRPIYIECRGDAIVLQPECIELTANEFAGYLGPGNPLASAVRGIREYWAKQAPAGTQMTEPYPLLLVRPEGIKAYYAARAALDSWGSDFGYELVGADWELAFPEPDHQLAKLEREIVADAAVRVRMLVDSMPELGNSRPRAQLHASARGGFEQARTQSGGGHRGSGRGDSLGNDWAQHSGSPGDSDVNSPGTGSPGGGDSPSGGRYPNGGMSPGGLAMVGSSYGNGTGPSYGTGPGSGAGPNGSAMGGGPYGSASGDSRYGGGGSAGQGGGSGQTGGQYGDQSGGQYGGQPGAQPGGQSGGAVAAQNGPYGGQGGGQDGQGGYGGQAADGLSGGKGYGQNGGGQPGGQLGMGGGKTPNAPGSTPGSGQNANPGGQYASTGGQGGKSGSQSGGNGGNSSSQPGSPQDAQASSSGGSSGSSSSSSSGSPGGSGASQSMSAGMPNPMINAMSPAKKTSSMAKTRGRDWGLPDGGAGTAPATRPILIECYNDYLVILPEVRGRAPKQVHLGPQAQPSMDEFVSDIWQHMKGWGPAGKNLYWRPTLLMEVKPGAADRYAEVKALLDDSGLDVHERTPHAATRKPAAPTR